MHATTSVLHKVTSLIRERRLPWRLTHRGGLVNTCVTAPVRQLILRQLVRRQRHQGPDDITVVIPVRNRCDLRLRNALASLRGQDYPAKLIAITLVDYGSDPGSITELESLARKFDASVIATPGGKKWNRGHCINIGLKRATSTFSMTSDADILFANDYLSSAVRMLKEEPLSVIYAQMLDLPEGSADSPLNDFSKSALRHLRDSAIPRTLGDCHASINITYTRFFHWIRGYDEFYREWGTEDNDLQKRFHLLGLRSQTIMGCSYFLHQWHPRYMGYDAVEFGENCQRNNAYYESTHAIVRNRGGWGIPTSSQANAVGLNDE